MDTRALLARLATLGFVVAAGCQQPVRDAPAASALVWDAFASEFIEATFVARPNVAVNKGRHEFDGKLPDFSAAGLKREIERLHAARDRARAFDAATLEPRRQLERDYVLAEIEGELFWTEEAERPWTNPGFYGFAIDPNVYLDREYAPLEQRMRAYIAYANGVPLIAAQARQNLRTPMPRTYVRLGRIIFGGLASYYEKDAPLVFAGVGTAAMREEFAAANAGAVRAMKGLDTWLAQQEAGATDGFAIGTAKFERMLNATERVDLPVARLKEIGELDLERNLAALREACARFAPGANLPECVAKMQAKKRPEGPVQGARAQLAELRAFIVEKGVVGIPGPELPLVAEAPAYRRWNAAYINIPGPFEKNLPSTYRIAPPDPAWSPAEQAAYIPGESDLLFISAHEVWPGHFLQHLHSNRSASMVGRVFQSYAFSEGWAHYAEEMMWEMGLGNGDPEVHIGQLTNALLRDVRYLSAIGLHTGGMTVQQSEAMFREKAFQDPGNARQQAARGTFDPAYGNYTLGKLMIRKRRRPRGTRGATAGDHGARIAPVMVGRGGRRSWQSFHDEFLSHGSPPIPLVRKAMLGPDAGPPL